MPKPKIPADGGAMSAKPPAKTLLNIEDEIDDVRQLIDAAYMATSDLSDEQQGPMQALLSLILDKLTEARDALRAYREVANV